MIKRKAILILILIMIVGCLSKTGKKAAKGVVPSEKNKEIGIYFCPKDNCKQALMDAISPSKKSVHCAFFDVDLKGLAELIGNKSSHVDVKLVVDDENYGMIKGPRVKKDTSSQYSHNKFCIIDSRIVTTGSMNPTDNGADKNNNNLLVINSAYLAKNYEDEFKELWDGKFGKGEKVKYPVIYLNGHKVENYFCPEDSCSKKIAKELKNAEKSIYFMAFSFTHEGIADAILFNDKADIKGLFEKRGSGSEYSQYNRLKGFGLDVRLDNNPYTMHHKVFIIDNSTVITGSMNPTASGDRKNDENILIIENKAIADRYLEEFFSLY